MNNYQKLAALKQARQRVKDLDAQKRKVYESTREMLGLDPMFNNAIWDYLINGLQFLRHDIATALKSRENYNNPEEYDRHYDDLG